MRFWRILLTFLVTLTALALLAAGLGRPLRAASAQPATIIPLGPAQPEVRTAYHDGLTHLYGGGRLWWAAAPLAEPAVLPGDLIAPEGLATTVTHTEVAALPALPRAYALRPGRVALFRSSVMVPTQDGGEVVAGWELADFRQLLDGYLLGAVPYTVLTDTQLTADLAGYDVLLVPAFRNDAREAVLATLEESGALEAIRAFVEGGGTLYAQGTGLFVAEAAGLLPAGTVDPFMTLALPDPEDQRLNRGQLALVMPESPLAYAWLTETLYLLDDPLLYPTEGLEVIARFTNADVWEAPAVVRYEAGSGQVLGVVGHPTDPTHRLEAPLFMDALLWGLAAKAELYGDAVQTFNPLYPPHEFPAYETVPVSVTLVAANLWDDSLSAAVVTERVAPGYTVLTETVTPPPTDLYTTPEGETVIVWNLDYLDVQTAVTLTYQAETDPQVLRAGVSTFSRGELAYTEPTGKPVTVAHRPFVLTAKMAARLVGDRDLAGDRHYRIPAAGLYLDLALPLENKESTLASTVVLTDWAYLVVPFVGLENQHVILNANDGETIWMLNEPYLWRGRAVYPAWEGATSPTQTITLDDWRALPEKYWCVFTSTYGIHTDPPPLRATGTVTDYSSFVTIPPTLTDAITVTADDQLLLPCYPLTWQLGDFPGYWYEEPAVRFGVHSYELLGREVVFQGTPRANTVVLPYDAGSVYVMAGTDPVPFREYLPAAEPYAPAAPTLPTLSWQDVWSRTHTMTLRATFYDVWDWDSCGTCDLLAEQHAGFAVTFGLWIDSDGDGTVDRPVKEIPTRLNAAQLRLLGKTYSAGDSNLTIPADENLIELPIFHGLGIRIGPEGATWYDSWRNAGPGATTLLTVAEQTAYDSLYFQQTIPPGSWASFVVSATIENYPFNREGLYKLHDGGRLVYRQPIAGPNRYEVYDAHVQAAEGFRSDGAVTKWGGPTAVSVYSDTLLFLYTVSDPHEPHTFAADYDPFMKSWGYGDFVATTYAGGREGKTLFHAVLGPGERVRVRESLDNNTGLTLTHLNVSLLPPPGITVTALYTDPATAPEPIWPELAFLNRTEVPDAWRSVWYFELTVSDEVDPALWGTVIEIPVVLTADNLPAGYEAPPVRLALQRPGDPAPQYVAAPAQGLVLTDTLPENVTLEAAVLITDPVTLNALRAALDHDAGQVLSDTAGELFATLTPTLPFTVTEGTVTFELPPAWQTLPAASGPLMVAARARLLHAVHGPNVVNEGPGIAYTDPFQLTWTERGPRVVVEAHGATVWVSYLCQSGDPPSLARAARQADIGLGEICVIPDEPSAVTVHITAYNEGDAVADDVIITVQLPAGVTPIGATPLWSAADEQSVTWHLGDLTPGGARAVEVSFWVEPAEGEWDDGDFHATATLRRLLGIRRTDGVFTDTFTQLARQGVVGGDFWFRVVTRPRSVYLPLVLRAYDPRPDLVVTQVTVNPAEPGTVQVRVANHGLSAARSFWVDAYFDPAAPPQGNQPWWDLNPGYGGAAWFVPELAAGGSLTLTLHDAFYRADYSRWPATYPAGPHTVWAYADSYHPTNPWGAVGEVNETNNRYGPVTFTGTGAAFREAGALPPLPARPAQPLAEGAR